MSGLDLPQSVEREMIAGSISRLLADTPRPGWRDLADAIGLAGLTAPEAAGGFGGGPIEIAVAMAELGPALAGADWLSHAAATLLIARLAPDHAVLPDLAGGMRRAAIVCSASCTAMPVVEGGAVHGSALLVAGAAEADMVLIADAGGIVLVADHAKVEQRHRIMHDGSVTADLGFALRAGDGESLADGIDARRQAEWIADLILAARCAEVAGLMQRMVADSADYMGQRRQFGAQIGSFQALRHRAADMQLALMKAAALTELAVIAVDRDGIDRARAVSAACVEVADAVRIVGEGAVQIHGAMGLTEELSLGAQFKRALSIAANLGSRAGHLARYAEAAA
ncbi:acyl-CoA dehydrogenase family protein [Sphingopyxis sp.]|uniref:acyl-CoA dehydrogenase family protein n=1 Tax=Sphingopyxis sp. TaxID=1908224 RepID=UPI003D124CB6